MRILRGILASLVLPAVLAAAPPAGNGDLNCDGVQLDISDIVTAVDFMFRGGPPPCNLDRTPANFAECENCFDDQLEFAYINLLQVTIEAPSSGFVRLDFFVHGANLGTGEAPALGLDTVPNWNSLGRLERINPQVPLTTPLSLVRMIPVEAGTHTYYGNIACSNLPGPYAVDQAQLVATFLSTE